METQITTSAIGNLQLLHWDHWVYPSSPKHWKVKDHNKIMVDLFSRLKGVQNPPGSRARPLRLWQPQREIASDHDAARTSVASGASWMWAKMTTSRIYHVNSMCNNYMSYVWWLMMMDNDWWWLAMISSIIYIYVDLTLQWLQFKLCQGFEMFLCSTCSSERWSQVTFQAPLKHVFSVPSSVPVYRFLTPLTRKAPLQSSSTVPNIKKRRQEYFSRKMVPWPKLERSSCFDNFTVDKTTHI